MEMRLHDVSRRRESGYDLFERRTNTWLAEAGAGMRTAAMIAVRRSLKPGCADVFLERMAPFTGD
jgi:hypothetical protein